MLGFDWHSSGVTTTTCGAIKAGITGLETDLGFFAADGKGGAARKTPPEISHVCETLSSEPARVTLVAGLDFSQEQSTSSAYQRSKP